MNENVLYLNENDLPEADLIALSEQAMAENRAIVIFHDTDGNYRGWTHKLGKFIQARAGDPNTVVTMLITHP